MFSGEVRLQGYLAYQKLHPPRTLKKACAWGRIRSKGGGIFLGASYLCTSYLISLKGTFSRPAGSRLIN